MHYEPLRIELLEQRLLLATFTVTTPADTGPGSLREAIVLANQSPGPDAIHFNLPAGQELIAPLTPLPEFTGPTTIDGTTQPGSAPGVPAVRIMPTYQPQHDTLRLVNANHSLIRGLVIAGTGSAIHVVGGRNVAIEGNHVGSLQLPLSGGLGVILEGAVDCTVGGTSPTQRNVIATNATGILVRPDASVPAPAAAPANHLIRGNYIGTNAAGTESRGSAYAGVFIDRTTGTVVGGAQPGARNVIASSYQAVFVRNGQAVVQGNHIGIDAAGRNALGNMRGVWVEAGLGTAAGNVIGGSLPGQGNLISGNDIGVGFWGENVTGSTLAGNLIGLDGDGAAPVPNRIGVLLANGAGNTIGGDTPASRNVVSGNTGQGMLLDGSRNVIRNNYVGTDVSGTRAIGNGFNYPNQRGVGIDVGGNGGDNQLLDNLISGNQKGVLLVGRGNTLRRNFIGTDASGTAAIPNRLGGVEVRSAGADLGGPAAGDGNVIAGNGGFGVDLYDSSSPPPHSTLTFVRHNRIGVGSDGRPLGNAAHGVRVTWATLTNVLSNTIAHNGGAGVFVDVGASSVGILGNSIHSNAGLGIGLGSSTAVTPNDRFTGDADDGPNGLQNFPVITSVHVTGAGTRVGGTIDGTPGASLRVEVFFSPDPDPSGYGEGAMPVRSSDVRVGADGGAYFSFNDLPPLPPGAAVTATASRLSGLPPGAAETSGFAYAVTVPPSETTGPRVTGAFVRSSRWSRAFLGELSRLGMSPLLGILLPVDGAAPLPWNAIDQISVRFSEPVVGEGLRLEGADGATYPGVPLRYDHSTHTMTWSLPRLPRADRLRVILQGQTDRALNRLDGELAPGGGLPSGDGVPGGEFVLPFSLLVGDVTRDGRVDSADLGSVRARLGASLGRGRSGGAAYSLFHDFNGDGAVDVVDLADVRRRQSTALPDPVAQVARSIIRSTDNPQRRIRLQHRA